MSILDANADALQTAAVNSRFSTTAAPPTPGTFSNFTSSAGNFFMRSMAEAGRSASMAFAAIPVLADKAISPGSMADQALGDKRLADRYFEFHDNVFGRAVDHWTPKPEEVGAAGQIVGSLAGGMVQFLANPALAVANAQLSTSEDLVRRGVDSGAALVAGDIAGLGTVAGIALPILGKTLGQRAATGIGGNLGQGVATAAATQAVLTAADAPAQVVADFNPLDPKARTVDALMGLVFGAKAHIDSRAAGLTQTQRDALMLVNQAQHIEGTSLPGRPASEGDLTRAVAGTREAIDQMLRGEPVAVADAPRFNADPARIAERADMARVVEAEMPMAERIQRPPMIEPEAPKPDTAADGPEAPAAPKLFDDSVRLPTGEFDPQTGEPVTISANDYVARATEEAATAKATASNLFTTAAECLLGSL